MRLRRILSLALLGALVASWAFAAGPEFRVGLRITTATTTTVLAGVAGQTIGIYGGSICVDTGGVTTGITLQDSTPTNVIGTSVVYALAAGQCLTIPRDRNPWYNITAAGTTLQVVTGAAGPINLYLELIQR
jgi:hypothetical protein